MKIKKNTPRFFLLKPLAACIGLGLGAMVAAAAHANTANANATPQPQAPFLGPFAQIPLHLQQTVSSAGSGVKPNVVLQLDNSGSMDWDIHGREIKPQNGNTNAKSRIEITRSALLWLLDNPEYKNAANWNMTTLYDLKKRVWTESDLWVKHNRDFLAGRASFERSPEQLSNLIRDPNVFFPVGMTPSTERYLDSLYLLQKAINRPGVQECQKSFVIIFSDGGQQSTSYVEMEREATGINQYNRGFRLKRGTTPKTGNYQTVFFAQQEPYTFGFSNENKLDQFRINTLYGDPQHNRDNFLTHDNYDPTRKGWSWTNHGSGLGNNTNGAGSKYFWVNRNNSLKFFAESAYDTDWNNRVNGKQNIQTFTIAFGITDPTAQQYLSGGAVSDRNPDSSKDLNGKVIDARSEQDLKNAFAAILDNIKTSSRFEPPSSFATVSPAVTRTDLTQKLPGAAAAAHLDLQSGSSEIRFYNVSGNDQRFDVNTSSYKVPSFNHRRFIIHANGQNHWLNSFSGSNDYFGITGSHNSNEWQVSLLPWLMREGSSDNGFNKTGNALKYRVRSTAAQRNMGDIINSPITTYGPIENGREKYLLTAANDGMVYMFKSSSDAKHPYDLKLNYIPADMERETNKDATDKDTVATHFKHIAHPQYVTDGLANPHRYLVNGRFIVRTMDKTTHQQVFMAGTMGQGGRGAYALNVGGPHRHTGAQVGIDAPETSWLTSVPLFETPKGASNIMGYTVGSPQIGRLALNRSVEQTGDAKMTVDLQNVYQNLFVGSGVRSPGKFNGTTDTSESALYIFNMFSDVNSGIDASGRPAQAGSTGKTAGALVQKLVAAASGGGLAEPTLVDTNFDGIIDVVYAGDYSGGLYRFDLRGAQNEWKVSKIFQTASKQPITSAPAVSRQSATKYVVIFGTGSDLYPEDLENKDSQAVYGIHDDLTNFQPTTKGVSDLVQQTITTGTASLRGQAVSTRKLSDNALTNPTTPAGWYFNLPDAGERVVVKPEMLLKTALIVTRQYKHQKTGNAGNAGNVGQCSMAQTQRTSTSSESWVMQVKADNGGNVPGKGGDESYAYADFLEQTNRTTRERPNEILSVKMSGVYTFSSLIETTGDPSTPGSKDSAVSKDGDSSRSGHDLPLSAGGNIGLGGRSDCFYDPDNKLLGQSSDGSKGLDAKSTDIYGKRCVNPGIRRLSWREIF